MLRWREECKAVRAAVLRGKEEGKLEATCAICVRDDSDLSVPACVLPVPACGLSAAVFASSARCASARFKSSW